jgi:hypothetical protein
MNSKRKNDEEVGCTISQTCLKVSAATNLRITAISTR